MEWERDWQGPASTHCTNGLFPPLDTMVMRNRQGPASTHCTNGLFPPLDTMAVRDRQGAGSEGARGSPGAAYTTLLAHTCHSSYP
eukprot:5755-Pelagomonas_calceolata.AAC.4